MNIDYPGRNDVLLLFHSCARAWNRGIRNKKCSLISNSSWLRLSLLKATIRNNLSSTLFFLFLLFLSWLSAIKRNIRHIFYMLACTDFFFTTRALHLIFVLLAVFPKLLISITIFIGKISEIHCSICFDIWKVYFFFLIFLFCILFFSFILN